MIIGFTGTSKGMVRPQFERVDALLGTFDQLAAVRHGDCVGADLQFHTIARRRGLFIVGHPPVDPRRRAWCVFDKLEPEADYLVRDRDMVDSSDLLVAAPAQQVEPKAKRAGGTWYTLRYARSVGKPWTIVWPDGTIEPS